MDAGSTAIKQQENVATNITRWCFNGSFLKVKEEVQTSDPVAEIATFMKYSLIKLSR